MDAQKIARDILAEYPRQYRKKPVVVTAMRYDGTRASATRIVAWAGGASGMIDEVTHAGHGYRLSIATLEGEMQARPGDYLIRGLAGEFYPCKPNIFEASYERVEQSPGMTDRLMDGTQAR
jgi:hypothetical protein